LGGECYGLSRYLRMSHNCNIGDFVQLKMGGPKMVVRGFECIGGMIKIRCEWVVKNETLTDAFFTTTLNHMSV